MLRLPAFIFSHFFTQPVFWIKPFHHSDCYHCSFTARHRLFTKTENAFATGAPLY